MSATNGHRTAGRTVVTGTRPIVLMRYRSDVAGSAARIVHLVPLPATDQACAAAVAVCGALLRSDQVETVVPGHGVPCSLCLLSPVDASFSPPATTATETSITNTRPQPAAVAYRAWGWPVTVRGDQVWLNLEPDTVALIIPTRLAEQVTALLSRRRCPPAVLSHPDMPDHRVVLASEPYGVDLPWPTEVHRAAGSLPLPPTTTPNGPVTWACPPHPDALHLCREIDIFAAVHTALDGSPPGNAPPSGDSP